MKERDHAEHDHAHHEHDEEEPRPAARVQGARAPHRRHVELPSGLERIDRLVLGAVVLEHAPHVGQERDRGQIAEHEADPDQSFDENKRKASAAMNRPPGQE